MEEIARENRERITRIEEKCNYIQGDIGEIKQLIRDIEQQISADKRDREGERNEDRKRNLGYIMALAIPVALAIIFALLNFIIERGQPL